MKRHARPVRHAGRDGRRRDANEDAIVAALRSCGASVTLLSVPGGPDLMVGFRRVTHLLEVKSETGKLEDSQVLWQQTWRGSQVHVVRTVDDALYAVGVVGGW